MRPYPILEQVATDLDKYQTREEISRALDLLEFIYEALDPELQDLASSLIGKLSARLDKVD